MKKKYFCSLLKRTLLVLTMLIVAASAAAAANSISLSSTFPDASIVQSSATGYNYLTATVPSGGVPAGSVIVICIYTSNAGNPAIADSRGNTYTSVSGIQNARGRAGVAILYTVVSTPLASGDTIKVTQVQSTGVLQAMTVSVWNFSSSSGGVVQVDTTSAYSNTATAGASTFTTPAITTAQSTELLVVASDVNSATSGGLSVGSGFSVLDVPTSYQPTTTSALSQYKLLSSSGSYSGAVTTTYSSTSQTVFLVAFDFTSTGTAPTKINRARIMSY